MIHCILDVVTLALLFGLLPGITHGLFYGSNVYLNDVV
jgi:hypothetical protein